MIINYWFNKKHIPYLLLLFITVVSTYQTLNFYFWHDDFSWFYHLRNGSCFSFWPYNTFCNFLSLFYLIFGYNPFWYYLIGEILLFSTVISFFILCRTFFEKNIAFLLASLFATVYIGSGAFVEAHSPLLVLTPLLLLILSLILLALSYKNSFKPILLIISVITFGISVFVVPIRSSTHIFPAVAYIFLFLNKISIKKRLFLSGLFVAIYYLTFFVLPLDSQRKSVTEGVSLDSFSLKMISQEVTVFIQTIGSLLFTDNLQNLFFKNIPLTKFDNIRFLIGLTTGISFFIYLWKHNVPHLKVGLFALVWIAFFYAPYGFKFDGRIPSNHRYLISIFPGIILAWGLLFNHNKYWQHITVFLILAGIIESNIFFNSYSESSQKRSSFYSQLHKLTKNFEKQSIIFFDIPPVVRNQATDFFRVGFYPSEAVIGTEYKIPFEKTELILQDGRLREYLVSDDFNTDHFYTYYYDGDLLTQTTEESRKRLRPNFKGYQSDINESQKAEFLFNENTESWTSSNPGIKFFVKDFVPVIPYKLSIEMSASIPPIKLPYTHGCINCTYNPTEVKLILDYLTKSKKIKNDLSIETSNSGEKTTAESIVDNTNESYWLANRQEWFNGKSPIIKIIFKDEVTIDGLILTSISNGRLPKDLEVTINGQKVSKEIVQIDDKRVKVIIRSSNLTNELVITVLKTINNDSPAISDIDIMPKGFKDIDVLKAERLENFPSSVLKTNTDIEPLKKYLIAGGKACIQWQQAGYGKGSEDINIFVDGQKHIYKIDLPVAGIGVPEFYLGCLNFPVDLEIFSASIEYLKGSN